MTRRAAGAGRARGAGPARFGPRATLASFARWAAVALLAGPALLAGCTADSGAPPAGDDAGSADAVGQGYVSGDGSVRTWPAARRPGPVALTGTSFDGVRIDTTAWRGDVVVVNTWYAGCAPCRKEAPALAALARERAADGVRVLGLNTTDDAGAALAFQRRFDVGYPSLEDRDGTGVANLSGTVPLQAVPTTVVLDRRGRVAARVIGVASASTLSALVDDVVAEAGRG